MAASANVFNGINFFPLKEPSIVTKTLQPASIILCDNDSAENPAN